jgi:polyphenol oxidase
MIKTQKTGISIFRFQNLSNYSNIEHFISGRKGGYSTGPFAALNTGFHVGDNEEQVLLNRVQLAKALGCDINNFIVANQTHSSNIFIASANSKGKGSRNSTTAIADTDALISNVPGAYICVQMADCVPVLLYDPIKNVVGAVHAGWKGTIGNISEKTVNLMRDTFNCKTEDVIAGIGPCNGPCCYEVGEDVRLQVIKNFQQPDKVVLDTKKPGKYIFDQRQANKIQLLEAGIKEENIEIADICTQCHSDEFFSSRAMNGKTGRFMAGIMIKS